MKKTNKKFKVMSLKSFSSAFWTVALIAFLFPSSLLSQKITVSGTVKTEKGDPIIGAVVMVANTTTGTTTDYDGRYVLSEVNNNATLEVSYLGYETVKIALKGRTTLDVTLQDSEVALEEVVVVGYGTMKKKDLTGAVGTLDGTKIAKRQTTQVSTALQGAMPGVTVTRTNSAPGATASIRVRGVTSMKESSPLVIVDGVPGSLSDVNPNDIENISVLKDAASAAIYGARAAAGVVLVTTKRASKEGKTNVSYSYSLALDYATDMPEFTDAVGYMKAENELAYNDNSANGIYSIRSKDYIDNYYSLHAQNPDLYPNTDWLSLILKDCAPRQRHNLSITASDKHTRTKISMGYDDVDGLFREHLSWKRYMIRVNNDINVCKWLDVSLDMNLKKTDAMNPYHSPSSTMRYASPIYAAEWSDGRVAGGKEGTNPYGLYKYGGTKKDNTWQVSGKLQFDLKPFEGMKVSGVFAPNYTSAKSKDFSKSVAYTPFDNPDATPSYLNNAKNTNLKETRTSHYSHTVQLFANYQKDIANDHHLTAMVGFEDYHYSWEDIFASRSQYTMSYFPYLSAGPTSFMENGNDTPYENGYQSYFGRVTYNYLNKYYLQANLRYDGSSRFNSKYRWGTFPSVSAGWVISQENFWKSIAPVVSFMKLRASYGELGNERIGYYPYQSVIAFNSPVGYQGNTLTPLQGASSYQLAIPDITWESTKTWDIGLDMNFLNDKLHLSFDYYKKKTTDMLIQLDIPNYMGYSAPYQNAGDMNTKGWDLDINWNDRIGDFGYSVSFNLSDYKSVMGYIGDSPTISSGKIIQSDIEYQAWYGYQTAGLFQTYDDLNNSPKISKSAGLGDVKHVDISGPNGVPDGIISPEYDRVVLGGSLPRFNFGGSISMDYKGFDFNLMFQGVGKRKSMLTSEMVQPLRGYWYNIPKFIVNNHWSALNTIEKNQTVRYPRYSNTSSTNNYAVSDFWLINGQYLRIKDITLGYTFPKEWIQPIGVKNFRLSATLSDFFTFSHFPTGWDPEVSSTGYPITKSVVFTAAIKF